MATYNGIMVDTSNINDAVRLPSKYNIAALEDTDGMAYTIRVPTVNKLSIIEESATILSTRIKRNYKAIILQPFFWDDSIPTEKIGIRSTMYSDTTSVPISDVTAPRRYPSEGTWKRR